jgi:hypothetical protein
MVRVGPQRQMKKKKYFYGVSYPEENFLVTFIQLWYIQYINYFCNVYPVAVHHIKINIRTTVNCKRNFINSVNTQYTRHKIQDTIHNTQYKGHKTQYTIHNAQYTIQKTQDRRQYTMHNSQYTMHNTQCTIHSAQYTIQKTQYTRHHSQCTIHNTIQKTQYTIHAAVILTILKHLNKYVACNDNNRF